MSSSGVKTGQDAARQAVEPSDVEERARRRVSEGCPYSFYFRGITYQYRDGVLTLRGRVPTYYLKQVLQQRLLRDLGDVTVENKVDVVNSRGLSTVAMS
jgi:hypothetical protein